MSTTIFNIKSHVLPGQYIREYPAATLEDQEDALQLHINQYTPQDESSSQPGAITIIAAHANGFPKELYEPLWEELYQRLKKLGISIRSIWMPDVVHQGKSSVINEDKLGNDLLGGIASWFDHTRDLLHMINHFRREMPRPLVGVGHSMGGGQLVNLSIIHPRLLSTLILIDPVIQIESIALPRLGGPSLAQMSTFRRDIWPSRAEAAEWFKKSKFYETWDERVLDRWIEHGLRDLPTKVYPQSPYQNPTETPVTLATSKHHEVFTFVRPSFDCLDTDGNSSVNRLKYPDMGNEPVHPFYRPEAAIVFLSLPHLRPSVFYIFGGQSILSPPDRRRQKMEKTGTGVGGSGGAREGRVHETVFEDAGHLIPMELVDECAQRAADFLAPELHRWREAEEEFRKAWGEKEQMQKVTITEEWKTHLGGDPKAKPPKL